MTERDDAWKILIAWDQRRLQEKDIQRLVPKEVVVHLSNPDRSIPHIIASGRVKNFPIVTAQQQPQPQQQNNLNCSWVETK